MGWGLPCRPLNCHCCGPAFNFLWAQGALSSSSRPFRVRTVHPQAPVTVSPAQLGARERRAQSSFQPTLVEKFSLRPAVGLGCWTLLGTPEPKGVGCQQGLPGSRCTQQREPALTGGCGHALTGALLHCV